MGQFSKEQDQATSAYGAMGTMGSGLGALGSGLTEAELAILRGKGDVAQAQQNLKQSALDRRAANAQQYFGLPANINAAALNAINAQPSSGGATGASTQQYGASPFAKGGVIKKAKPTTSPYTPPKTMKKQRGTR
jgi:O-glycosyl hydrolase